MPSAGGFCATCAFKLQFQSPDRNNRLRIEREMCLRSTYTPPSCECELPPVNSILTCEVGKAGIGGGGRYVIHTGYVLLGDY